MELTDEQEKWLRKSLLEDIEPLAQSAFGWWVQEAFTKNKLPDAQLAQWYLDGIDNGDPEIFDMLPHLDWSGQWADGLSWDDLFDSSWYALMSSHVEDYEEQEYLDIESISDDLFIELGDGEIVSIVESYCRSVLEP